MRLRSALVLALAAALPASVLAPSVLAQTGKDAAAPPKAAAPAPAAAAPGGGPVTPERMAAHRAAYRLELDRARDNANVASARGAMLYEVVDACEGWATRQLFSMVVTDRDGRAIETTSDYSTFEQKDGRRLRFTLTQTSQGAVSQRVAGEAVLEPDGSGVVRYTDPAAKEERLPAGTLLPTLHTIRALNAAREGQRLLIAPLFDGTSPDGAQDTTTVLSAWQGPTPIERFPALSALGSARMTVAFFDRGAGAGQGGGAATPDYEVSLRYWENGVADELRMNFGDFAVGGQLVELQPVSGGC